MLNNAIEIGRRLKEAKDLAAYNKVAANKIAFLYENLDKVFKELAYEMTKFASIDPDVHAAYKKMVNDFLIKAMQERLGG